MAMDMQNVYTSDLVDDATFWSWVVFGEQSASTQEIFAEFIVRALLGSSTGYDSIYFDDYRLTLQASAVIHTYAEDDTLSIEIAADQTDCHIVCLFTPHKVGEADVVDPWQWCFFVLSPDYVASLCKQGCDVSLTMLMRLCVPLSYDMLPSAVDAVLHAG